MANAYKTAASLFNILELTINIQSTLTPKKSEHGTAFYQLPTPTGLTFSNHG